MTKIVLHDKAQLTADVYISGVRYRDNYVESGFNAVTDIVDAYGVYVRVVDPDTGHLMSKHMNDFPTLEAAQKFRDDAIMVLGTLVPEVTP
jgi:hypothetical protein